jgi:Mn2+/Fe2+ NRAMP family transporter
MDERQQLQELTTKPVLGRIAGYARLSGPGYLQSAMTLGGGSVASCVVLGSLASYKYLWVQPLAILLGYFVLASIAKQTTYTEARPYKVFWERLHPGLALIWGGSAFLATIMWHIPQYSLTANGVVELTSATGLNLDSTPGRIGIGVVVLLAACAVVYLYNSGARGLRIYENAIKFLVWSIVIAFGYVAIRTGIQWDRLFAGITGIAFIQDLRAGTFDERAIAPIVGGLAAAVGINMIFLYPYSLLNRKWGKEHKELAYFDLMSGMVIPFLIATTFMVIAVANTIGPADDSQAASAVRDLREIVPVLAQTFGETQALLLIGFGLTAIGFSTIVTHMLATGFIGCEMFGYDPESRAKWVFSLVPAIGVIGVLIKFPWFLAITASTLAAPLMPVTVICFLILLNRKTYMGDQTPVGGYRLLWNGMLVASILIMSVAASFGLKANWKRFQDETSKPDTAQAALMQTQDGQL